MQPSWRGNTTSTISAKRLHTGARKPVRPIPPQLHNRGVRYARQLAYATHHWPAAITLSGVNYNLRGLGGAEPGLAYSLRGPGHLPTFPHITLHNLSIEHTRDGWRQHGYDYQIVLGGGAANTYPFENDRYSPFGNNNPTVADPAAIALAAAFRARMLL